MKSITSIEPQSRPGTHRVNVFLEGSFAFALAEELAFSLMVGSFLSEAEVADLQRRDDLHKVYDAALNLLSYRPRSVSELRSRLLRKSLDPALVEEALERLQREKILDDVEFAQFWVDNRRTHRPRGGRMLQAELRAKGVDREIIEEVLPEPSEEEAAAYRLALRKAASLASADWREFRQRVGDHLVRRGFGYEVAGSVARRLWEERGQAEPDDAPEET